MKITASSQNTASLMKYSLRSCGNGVVACVASCEHDCSHSLESRLPIGGATRSVPGWARMCTPGVATLTGAGVRV